MPSRKTGLLTLAIVVILGVVARAADDQQTVWLVSTRGMDHCDVNCETIDHLCYWRLTDDCQWVESDAKEFRATDDVAQPTVVFVHGNRTDADLAVAEGLTVHQRIQSAACGRRFRYVIWSWPSDRVGRRNRPDVQLKADYSSIESHYLAAWLGKFSPGVKVSLMGHSYGPRIILGAMHLLGGGEVACQRLPAETVAEWSSGKRNPVRAILLASAADADCLSPDADFGRAVPLLDEALISCNGCDRALRWYPRLYGRRGPDALGFVGPCCLDDADKLRLLDLTCSVGKHHDWRYYVAAPELCCHWAHFAFLDEK